ncbi:GntR family transcriptional regulator [Streptomyces sp. NPDC005538]|uniref:GntR family transcriptional regulator n=1 Tax=Streptomyces sp. NPDC005538 TaxID=3157043 RepID=UPI0033A8B8D3
MSAQLVRAHGGAQRPGSLCAVIESAPSDVPEFRRVADILRTRLRARHYAAGVRLPAAPALAEELGSNRSAVERAVRVVAAEGLLITKPGSGAYAPRIVDKLIWDGAARYRPSDSQSGDPFHDQLRDRGLAPREITNERSEAPPADVAALLAVADDQALPVHEVFAYAADRHAAPDDLGTPLRITRTYTRPDTNQGKEAISHFTANVDTRPPAAEEAAFLNVDADSRVFRLLHTGRDENDLVIAVSVHILPLSLWSLAYRWPSR